MVVVALERKGRDAGIGPAPEKYERYCNVHAA